MFNFQGLLIFTFAISAEYDNYMANKSTLNTHFLPFQYNESGEFEMQIKQSKLKRKKTALLICHLF